MSERICETCVYCSLAGNCDRYNKPLTSIELPACDGYEIHPLLAENAKLRERVAELEELTDGKHCIPQEWYAKRLAENDRLHELVRDVSKAARMLCVAWNGPCSKKAEGMTCPIGDTSELCVYGKLHDRLRELELGMDA